MSSHTLSLAAWAAEFTFIRTRPGHSLEIAKQISSGDASKPPAEVILTTYGHFDLIMARAVTNLHHPPKAIIAPGVLEIESFRFFPWSFNKDQVSFISSLAYHSVNAMISAKIEPSLVEEKGIAAIEEVIGAIRQLVPPPRPFFVFHGLGHSEIIITVCDNSLEKIFSVIDQIRYLSLPSLPAPNLIAKTSSFLLVNHPELGRMDWDALKGPCHPAVSISCNVEAEREVEKSILSSFRTQPDRMLALGYNDIQLSWSGLKGGESLELSEFAQNLTAFRRSLQGRSGSYNSCTLFVSPIKEAKAKDPLPQSAPPAGPVMVPVPQAVFDLPDEFEALRYKALAFFNRWNSARNDPLAGRYFEDMRSILDYLGAACQDASEAEQRLAGGTGRVHDYAEKYGSAHAISQIITYSGRALFERQASLESNLLFNHPNGVPFLSDISGIVAAAAVIPQFLFECINDFWPKDIVRQDEDATSGKVQEEIWQGYVTFGQSLSHQYLPGEILSYPDYSIFTPLESWWQISHECGHHAFDLFGVFDLYTDDLATRMDHNRDLWMSSPGGGGAGEDHAFAQMQEKMDEARGWAKRNSYELNELFAQWFDFVFIFKKDYRLYLKTIWRSWSKIARIWERPEDYFLRSLAIYKYSLLDSPPLVPDENNGEDPIQKKKEYYRQVQRSYFDGFVDIFHGMAGDKPDLSAISGYCMAKKEDFLDNLINVSDYLGFLRTIEKKTAGLDRAINSIDQPETHLRQVEAIKKGEVIFDALINPKELLYAFLADDKRAAASNINSNIALILSFWNHRFTKPAPKEPHEKN